MFHKSLIPNFFFSIFLTTTFTLSGITIPKEKAKQIGLKIWNNECAKSTSGLCSWNEGENFASMGIGHFIWYHNNSEDPYEEQFPKLLTFLEENGVALPVWLTRSKTCPWCSRKLFLQDTQREKITELRTILVSTIDLQVIFMSERLEKALPKILESAPSDKKQLIRTQFYRVAECPNGLYALLDYINFKGEGSSSLERYKDQGWGLLQILEQMSDSQKDTTMKDFVSAGKAVLMRRVANAPTERGEDRWLKGWFNRLDTYLTP
ncbi:MAG: hypothetical protein AAGG81_04495 [Chlamydiota bacterium]